MPRHELVDPAIGPAVDQAGQQVGELDLRIDAVQLAGLDQGRHGRPSGTAVIATGEQRVFSTEHQGSDGPLDRVDVELDAAILEETAYAYGDGRLPAMG